MKPSKFILTSYKKVSFVQQNINYILVFLCAKIMEKCYYPLHALVNEEWKLCFSLEVTKDTTHDPTAIKKLHGMQWQHPWRRMDPQRHGQSPSLDLHYFID
jgi:hypothetical protein